MAVAEGLTQNIQKGILGRVYGEEIQSRYRLKGLVQQLMGVILAARKSGMTWEEIAAEFAKQKVEIAPTTLKRYVTELKNESELMSVAKKIVSMVEATRAEIQAERQLEQGVKASEAAAGAQSRRRMSNKVKLVANSDLPRTVPAAPAAERSLATVTPLNSAPAAAAATTSASSGASAKSVEAPAQTTGAAKTIAELKQKPASAAVDLSEDLVLQPDGRVYLASGGPYAGELSGRQIRLLENSRRLLASQPAGRSAKDFMKLNDKL